MSSSYDRFQKRRLLSSYFSVVLSVFLVLFLLGILGLFLINSKRLADAFKENIAMTVYFNDEANDTILNAFDAEMKSARFIKSHEFISKDQAAKEHKDIIGEDFMTFLGENPLKNSFDLHLKADYIEVDSIAKIEARIKKNTFVEDISYEKVLVQMVNDNIKKVSMYIFIASGILAVIAVLLINSSMRLSIYSNRFIIKTMQMVGATKSFIRKPFIMRSIKLGMLGATLAVIALIALLYYINQNHPDLDILYDQTLTAAILAGVFVAGIIITWISTFFATQRFLNLKTDQLY